MDANERANVKEKISKIIKALNTGLYEREQEIKLALLSSIAGESIFLLGPPGVAKSMVARRLKYAYLGDGKDGGVFEYLMNRFSTPDEIFGPVAISKLKNDTYERIVDEYLPGAQVVFLDEIWKAGPSIQNALLTVINEKVYRNGGAEIKVPMKALVSASNELPESGHGLEALWDRFLVRLVVKNISNKNNFNKMVTEKSSANNDFASGINKITNEEYETWSELIDDVEVGENVLHVVHHIRRAVAEYNAKAAKDANSHDAENEARLLYVSDRRWRKIVRLLRASAFLNGRSAVDLMDCYLIAHCIWDDESQIKPARIIVKDAIETHGCRADIDVAKLRNLLLTFSGDVGEYITKARAAGGKHDAQAQMMLDSQASAILTRAEAKRAVVENLKNGNMRSNLFVKAAHARNIENALDRILTGLGKIEDGVKSFQVRYRDLIDVGNNKVWSSIADGLTSLEYAHIYSKEIKAGEAEVNDESEVSSTSTKSNVTSNPFMNLMTTVSDTLSGKATTYGSTNTTNSVEKYGEYLEKGFIKDVLNSNCISCNRNHLKRLKLLEEVVEKGYKPKTSILDMYYAFENVYESGEWTGGYFESGEWIGGYLDHSFDELQKDVESLKGFL